MARAQSLREALDGDDLGSKMAAQSQFDEAVSAHSQAVLDAFEMEPPQ